VRPVVVYLQPGTVPQTRQLADCLAHCNLHQLHIAAVVPPHRPGDAVATVLAGLAFLILAAYSPRARPGDLRDLAAVAGVPVDYVRAPVVRREIAQLLARMYQRADGNVRQVADQAGLTSQEIRIVLTRFGVLRNDTPPDSRKRVGRRDDAR
jgi:hypothetical protein